MNVLYKTTASATGGRTGQAATADGVLKVDLVTPKELGGTGGNATNPEQLFAAGYAACFLGAIKVVAGQQKKTVPADAKVTAEVGIGANPKGAGFAIDVALTASLPGLTRAEAEALVQEAHKVCPYSNATRGNVDVRLSVA
jgi:Ohr subfamily peroxiredoxin